MLVLKFGGTSVGSPQAIRSLVSIVQDAEHTGRVRLVVVSAFSKVTDTLIDMAKKAEAGDQSYAAMVAALKTRHLETVSALIPSRDQGQVQSYIDEQCAHLERILEGVAAIGELSPKTLDLVMSFGERLSAFIIAQVFTSGGHQAEYLDARQVVRTDDQFGSARFLPEETYPRIQAYLANHPALQIATGFIGATEDGKTTTLGRGGSDLSAA
ncbi:MAG TPA: bifunctional aspartate kinase/homoserine dehydrogenase I, partial [Treponema sp.]|nr:bifunctional aspartate kinase/homoserine dehydrogenase I [Treponema sp.]